MSNPIKRVVAWWQARQERKRREDRAAAAMVALLASMPGAPQPSLRAQRWVNRTLHQRVFTEGE